MGLPSSVLLLTTLLYSSFTSFASDQAVSAPEGWTTVSTPFRAVNITANGDTLWVCGADEMILTSKDGGSTWETKHQNRDGEVLLNISFVDNKVGFAGGTGGLLLSTSDGGQTWKSHKLTDTVRVFSFADAQNGLAILGSADSLLKRDLPAGTVYTFGAVEVTHDGGDHWEKVTALESDDLRPFTQVLSIAALDSTHYLMIRRHPEIEDAFVVTNDGAKTWKLVHMQNDSSNRVMARTVLVHQGEYCAFGHELVHREKGGGYGVPLTMHSKDGEAWTHGVGGPNEFGACNSQGCNLWDGVVESLYGQREQSWDLPQDGSLTEKWALAVNKACTVSDSLKCATARLVDKPRPRPEGIVFISTDNGNFAEGCLECKALPIIPDKPGATSMTPLHASIAVHRDGTVANVAVDCPASKRLGDIIADQLSKWLFEPGHGETGTVETKKDVSMILMCHGFPGQPETYRCTLRPQSEFPTPTELALQQREGARSHSCMAAPFTLPPEARIKKRPG